MFIPLSNFPSNRFCLLEFLFVFWKQVNHIVVRFTKWRLSKCLIGISMVALKGHRTSQISLQIFAMSQISLQISLQIFEMSQISLQISLQIFEMSQISLQISLQIFAMSQISLQISLQIFAMSQILSHTLSHTLLHSLHICAGHFFKSLKGLKVVWGPAFIPLTCTHGWVVGCSFGMIDYSSALSACVYNHYHGGINRHPWSFFFMNLDKKSQQVNKSTDQHYATFKMISGEDC